VVSREGGVGRPTPGGVWGGSKFDNRISGAYFLTVFHSNYGSILLSFPDMTTERTTDGLVSAINAYLAFWRASILNI